MNDNLETKNINKIAFIFCLNEISQYSEARRYIDNLTVPEGYETDIIAIQEASSMCEGYNGGMAATDAKYKVYMHQDVRIINKNFISDLLKIFEDKSVGLVGMVGTRKIKKNMYAVSSWDTGKVYYNFDGFGMYGYNKPEDLYTEVDAVDGLLFATQYDVLFREDIFTEFDFDDISICYEHKRRGNKVVVASQVEPWVYHDDHYSNMKNYDVNRHKFISEYGEEFGFAKEECVVNYAFKDEKIIEQVKLLENVINERGMNAVAGEIIRSNNLNAHMREINFLAHICYYESDRSAFDWDEGIQGLRITLDELRRFVKRVEYDLPMDDYEYRFFCENYSLYSMVNVVVNHCLKKKKVFEKLYKYILEKDIIEGFIKETTNKYSWKNEMRNFKGVELLNVENWTENRNILLVFDKDDFVKAYFNEQDMEKLLIISSKKSEYIKYYANNNIPVIIGFPMCIKFYAMEMNWCIEKVCVIGEGIMTDEARRLFANSHIKVEEFLN